MDITGGNNCHVCNNEINWHAWIPEHGQTMSLVHTGQQVQTIVATGALNGTHGRMVKYEITVLCNRCGAANKFKIIR